MADNTDTATFLQGMDDERFEAYAETHWTDHQQIIRGNSNKAADASWATYDAIRAERRRRAAAKAGK
jgi:hypothetical protein